MASSEVKINVDLATGNVVLSAQDSEGNTLPLVEILGILEVAKIYAPMLVGRRRGKDKNNGV